jgi:hypothetical protein
MSNNSLSILQRSGLKIVIIIREQERVEEGAFYKQEAICG